MGSRSCLLLLLFLVSADHTSAACGDQLPDHPCVPVTDANCVDCTDPSSLVPDPFDCHSYYVCDSTGALTFPNPFDCPDGQVFDPDILKCVSDSTCQPICTSPVSGDCLYSCGADPTGNIALADPYDCSTYYKCDGTNVGIAQGCPSTAPYFDGASCQKDITRCCHCHPYCYDWDQNKLVDDPTDCRKYHGCTTQGKPAFSGKCDPSEYFDAHLKKCSVNAPCITVCKNVVDSDGCIDPYTCEAVGFFAKCQSRCISEYYHCKEVSDTYIDPDTCPDGYLFHPDDHVCVKNDTCPYL